MGKESCIGFVSIKLPPIKYLKDDMSFFDDRIIDSCTTTKFRYYMTVGCAPEEMRWSSIFFDALETGNGKCIQYGGPLHYPVQGRQLCGNIFYLSVSGHHCPCLCPRIYPTVLRTIHLDQVYHITICIYILIYPYHHTLCEADFISFYDLTTHLCFDK